MKQYRRKKIYFIYKCLPHLLVIAHGQHPYQHVFSALIERQTTTKQDNFANDITVWETFKAYIQGILISQKGFRDRAHRKVNKQLRGQIEMLEHAHKSQPNKELLDEWKGGGEIN